ncbi:YibE/F family protein [Planosporangium sp. 12N6]|uniref:YibE/F family protein n=1 Tax=Planosporangium spinosum TaxID=3402278 RepID=UPI003CFBB9CE
MAGPPPAEGARANPTLTGRWLHRAAARVGRAHIASVINTVILAYAGASLPLLILLSAGQQPLVEVLTSPNLAEEIVLCVVGIIGLIAAVPLTTALAAAAVHPDSGAHPADVRSSAVLTAAVLITAVLIAAGDRSPPRRPDRGAARSRPAARLLPTGTDSGLLTSTSINRIASRGSRDRSPQCRHGLSGARHSPRTRSTPL